MRTDHSHNAPSSRPSAAGRRVATPRVRAERSADASPAPCSRYSRERYSSHSSQSRAVRDADGADSASPRATKSHRSSRFAASRRASNTPRARHDTSSYTPLFEGTRAGDAIRFRRALQRALAGAAALALVIGVAFFMISNAPITVNVNGTNVHVAGNKTVADAFAAAGEPAAPGDLVDVEGAVLEQGAGYRFSFSIDGQPGTDHQAKLSEGNAVTFTQGGNIEEESDAQETAIPFETSDEGYGPVHMVTNPGVEGISVTKTGKISGKTVTQETRAPENRIYHRYYPDTGGEKVVALTFDDGPWEGTTAEILDILKEHGAKATFFTVGQRIDGAGIDLIKREAAEGHQVCTHTWSHASGSGQGVNLSFMSRDEQRDEISKGLQAIADATGADASKVIRSPGGNFPTEVWVNVDDLITAEIGWDIDTEDWRRPGSSAIAERIKAATPGDIILMHDGGGDRTQTVEAVREAIPYLKEQGFTFITMDEMMQYPPKQL